ncbi:MAG: hypothetical protein IID39_06870 [Planctomycetes bacterium]|nr:hypothetical protein [Planctomycetota bacterium]
MINHLIGQLVEVLGETVVVERAGIGYSVHIPRYALAELAACLGRQVKLHTMLFVEASHQSNQLTPMLVGFPHPEDKLFFRRFISVKGIGSRKALKAMAESPARVAQWIESGDTRGLGRLPGIGARAAELIVAELKGKMDDIAIGAGAEQPGGVADLTESQRDALEIMMAWGDTRSDVERWLERAARLKPDLKEPDEWVRAAYRVKTGAEG